MVLSLMIVCIFCYPLLSTFGYAWILVNIVLISFYKLQKNYLYVGSKGHNKAPIWTLDQQVSVSLSWCGGSRATGGGVVPHDQGPSHTAMAGVCHNIMSWGQLWQSCMSTITATCFTHILNDCYCQSIIWSQYALSSDSFKMQSIDRLFQVN